MLAHMSAISIIEEWQILLEIIHFGKQKLEKYWIIGNKPL
jgi:hypothetical protein